MSVTGAPSYRSYSARWVGTEGSGSGDALGDALRAPAEREQAGLRQLADAVRLEHAQQRGGLRGVAGDLDDERLGRDVDDGRPEERDELQHLAAGGAVDPHLHEQVLVEHA